MVTDYRNPNQETTKSGPEPGLILADNPVGEQKYLGYSGNTPGIEGISFTFGANHEVVGKTNPQSLSGPGAFKPVEGAISDLANHIGKGLPWMSVVLDEGKPRWQAHANHAEVLALDIDQGMTIDEALQRPFIRQYCALVIESASSTPEHNKFRLVFILPEAIEGNQNIKGALKYLMSIVPQADKACKDASRFFFGAEGREPRLMQEVTLPDSFVEDAEAYHQGLVAAETRRAETARRQWQERRAANPGEDEEALLKDALNAIDPNCDYSEWLAIGMALCAMSEHYFHLWDGWSSGARNYNSREMASRWRSFRGKDGSPSVIFGIAKRYGYRLPKARRSASTGTGFSRSRPVKVVGAAVGVFAEVQELTERELQIERRNEAFDALRPDLERDYLLPNELPQGEIIEYEGFCPLLSTDGHPDTLALQGLYGAGKTEVLLNLVSIFNDQGYSVIWLAPLNGLLLDTMRRAREKGIETHRLQEDVFTGRFNMRSSEATVIMGCPQGVKPYHYGGIDHSKTVVIIDEFSAVRAIIPDNTTIITEFTRAVRECHLLCVADANLSEADLTLVNSLRPGYTRLYQQKLKKSDKKIKIIETRNKKGDISFTHTGVYLPLIESLVNDPNHERVVIATDSKLAAKIVKAHIESLGSRVGNVLLISSETVEDAKAFLSNADKTLADRQIRVLIYTPTVGSGVDIQTPFSVGLCLANGVLSPKGMLQMMGRCRECPEWYVSAPRFAMGSDVSPKSMSREKVAKLAEQANKALEELEVSIDPRLTPLAVWQDFVTKAEKAYNSEYLYEMLCYQFESVEVVEVPNGGTREWNELTDWVKTDEAQKALGANLERGRKLAMLDRDSSGAAPKTDTDVWDLALGKLSLKYPEWIAALVAAGPECEEAIAGMKVLLSSRINKIRNWVAVTNPDIRDMPDLSSGTRKHSLGSQTFKQQQQFRLFQVLELESLARLGRSEKNQSADDMFAEASPEIAELYQEFRASAELVRLFPLVLSRNDFWGAIKSAMRYFGYRSQGKIRRVQSETFHPNGFDRKGKQRYSNSVTQYFLGWLIMNESGNAFFREHFEVIIQNIKESLATERKGRKAKESPPTEMARAA